ncbi:MAG TPA: 4'-phosphopantetheinyl transferase superfamily protein [Verrucomicrobiae bacterium]|nr:4'-phosphopantetheinyl transferase superfamily protein [Verrucomicrobiae bacterium]
MNVYWLEQAEVDVRVDDDWLSANEAASLGGIHFPKRRADWRLGRWTAKCALSVTLDLPVHSQPLRKIEIRAALSGWPQVFFCNRPLARSISLSHRAGVAACAVSMSSAELGCDLEMVEPRSEAFVADYFSIEEQALVASVSAVDRPRLLALLWSAKESTLKALRVGLRLDTRSVVVFPCAMSFDCNGWNELRVHYTSGRNAGDLPVADRLFHGWWHYADNMVRTLVAAPPPDPPIRLRIPVCVPNASFLFA